MWYYWTMSQHWRGTSHFLWEEGTYWSQRQLRRESSHFWWARGLNSIWFSTQSILLFIFCTQGWCIYFLSSDFISKEDFSEQGFNETSSCNKSFQIKVKHFSIIEWAWSNDTVWLHLSTLVEWPSLITYISWPNNNVWTQPSTLPEQPTLVTHISWPNDNFFIQPCTLAEWLSLITYIAWPNDNV